MTEDFKRGLTTGLAIGGVTVKNNIIFHANKTALTETDATGTNALHVGYSKTGNKLVGANSTLFTSGLSLLGVELATSLPPIITEPVYLYRLGNEYTHITGGWQYTSDHVHGKHSAGQHEPTKRSSSIYFLAQYGHNGYGNCESNINTVGSFNLRGATKLCAKVNVVKAANMSTSWAGIIVARKDAQMNTQLFEIQIYHQVGVLELSVDIPEQYKFDDVRISVFGSSTGGSTICEYELLELWLEGSQPPIVKPDILYLYNNGDENVSITGELGLTLQGHWPYYTVNEAEKLTDRLRFKAEQTNGNLAKVLNSKNKIKVQDYNMLCVEWDCKQLPNGESSWGFVGLIHFKNAPSIDPIACGTMASTIGYEVTKTSINKQNLDENGYAYLYMYGTTTQHGASVDIQIKKIWLE